jgi:hypothetical protein
MRPALCAAAEGPLSREDLTLCSGETSTGGRDTGGSVIGAGRRVAMIPCRERHHGSGCSDCAAEQTRWRKSLSSCRAGASSQCADMGYGCLWTDSSSVESN